MTMTVNNAAGDDWAAPMGVKTVLETTKGDIALNGFSGLTWHASSAIDLDSVIAVRIGDNRIELKG